MWYEISLHKKGTEPLLWRSFGTEDRENNVTAKIQEEEIGLFITSPEFV